MGCVCFALATTGLWKKSQTVSHFIFASVPDTEVCPASLAKGMMLVNLAWAQTGNHLTSLAGIIILLFCLSPRTLRHVRMSVVFSCIQQINGVRKHTPSSKLYFCLERSTFGLPFMWKQMVWIMKRDRIFAVNFEDRGISQEEQPVFLRCWSDHDRHAKLHHS